MSSPELLRVVVAGATGTVGRELIGLLQERRFPIQRLVLVASRDSLGQEIEWLGHDLPVEAEAPPLPELDLIWLCTPASVAIDWIRDALRSEVPCLDLSSALAERPENQVPLGLAGVPGFGWASDQPLMAGPAGPVLMLAPVLRALHEAAGLVRVSATVLESASSAGSSGIEALRQETLALFQEQEVEVSEIFPTALAFDCLPSADSGDSANSGHSAESAEGADRAGTDLPRDREAQVASHLARLLPESPPLSVTSLRVPTFGGCGIQILLETERGLLPAEAADCLSKAPGIVLEDFPTTRGSIGSDDVAVGRVRPDPGAPPGRGLQLWLAGDPVRLAAANAVELARQRFFGADASGA